MCAMCDNPPSGTNTPWTEIKLVGDTRSAGHVGSEPADVRNACDKYTGR